MLVIATPAAALKGRPGRWRYLGKDPVARRVLEERLGASEPMGDLVHREALRLKEPFLALIASIGMAQEPVAWWSSSTSWRSWGASDLFLLCCFQAAAAVLADAGDGWLVVEDPWLFRQLAVDLAGRIRAEGDASLPLREALMRARGILARLRFILRAALFALRQRAAGPLPSLPKDGVLLYPYFLPRSLKTPGRWTEFYLTGLADELSRAGTPSLTAVGPAVGFTRELAAIPDVLPLARLIGPRELWRAWRAPAAPLPENAALGGRPIDLLLRREAAVDASRSARCDFALSFEAFFRALSAATWKAVVYPWENQPQERLLALACRRAGVRAAAYQHTSVPALQLEFFPGPGELDWAPWPDAILCSGPRWLDVLADGGVPRGRLKLAGSRRFAHLHGQQSPAPGGGVLVALPIDRWQGLQLLDALRRAYPSGGEAFPFFLKPHPAAEWNLREAGFDAEIFDGPFADALRRARCVVGTGSASILEALAFGRPALRVMCETALNVDPGEAAAEAIPACFPASLRSAVASLLRTPAPAAAQRRLAAALFSPVAPAVWLEAVGAAGRSRETAAR